MQLRDTTATAFQNDSANNVFSITKFNETYWALVFPIVGGGTDYVTGYFNDFSPIVPIPSALWLFGSGLLGLIGVARRKAA